MATYGPEALKVVEIDAVLADLAQDRRVVQRRVGSADGGVARMSCLVNSESWC